MYNLKQYLSLNKKYKQNTVEKPLGRKPLGRLKKRWRG
jgi:hypothetical protein